MRENFGTRVRVSTVSFNRQVLLTGEVPNLQDKQAVEDMVKKIQNVTSVVNELGVRSSPSLVDRSSDLLITGRLKAVTDIARTIPGTQRVVRIFETISEDELRRLQPQRSEPAVPPKA